MPQPNTPLQYRFKLHDKGPALWPEHKPLDEVLELRDTTPALIWEGTFQGNPSAPGGHWFRRDWFHNNRFRLPLQQSNFLDGCVARFISYDTAFKDTKNSAFSARIVGELGPDYRLRVMHSWRDRVIMPDLLKMIREDLVVWNQDKNLWSIIIEDKASGISAYQTLMSEADEDMQRVLVAYPPTADKDTRCQQASVWCANQSVILPEPSIECPWLATFEDELFSVPSSQFRDLSDAFAQLVLWTEHLLAEGYHARRNWRDDDD